MAKQESRGLLSMLPGYSYRGGSTNLLNDPVFVRIFAQLSIIALSQYKIEGLPETMPERYVKRILFEHGRISFTFDPILDDIVALQVVGDERRDIYGEPRYWYGTSWNGEYRRPMTNANAVIVYTNPLKIATQFIAIQYAEILTKIYKAMRTNLSSTRTPIVVNCSKTQERQIKMMMRDLDDDAHFLFVESDGLREKPVTTLQTQPAFYVDRLQSSYMTEFNNFLTAIGVNNTNIEKKERVNTDEVAANNTVSSVAGDSLIHELEIGFDAVNALFGTSITVERNEYAEYQPQLNETESTSNSSDITSKPEGSNENG